MPLVYGKKICNGHLTGQPRGEMFILAPAMSRLVWILVSSGLLAGAVSAQDIVPAGKAPQHIQMVIPGFTVREVPLQLKNINSLVYAPDGRLFALAYNGNVWQLKDTNGDGLEDTASLFFKNESNAIPPSIGMAWGPGGLYIASKERIIRLRDKGDGTGELQTVTGGWQPMTIQAGSGLDAIGIAVDAAGNIYFGLGCDAWRDEYLVDKHGKSHYNVDSARGTIEKISADWQRRETVATGVRFTVCMAFNAEGDLFCTDQEGATWLPNGNPFDELLHIQPGRHYGFPPRHPKYLPDVIDEPSTYDYAPQHQSTCGLHFDEPVAGSGKIFGPSWWRGDAIVTGESRGKLWHTRLVKTAAGYVAQNSLFACLDMLTIDAVPTPAGDLLITCHSGSPDWGSGPEGFGKLFKISYTDRSAPQPVLAYAASPTETRVVFDRPLDAAQWKNLAAKSLVTMGKYAEPAERLESFHPGYEVINYQHAQPRTELKVLSAGITADGREIALQTAPHTQAVNYAVKLQGGATNETAAIDALADLTGAEAEWRGADGNVAWSGWLPHLDLTAARGLTAGSAEHERLFLLMNNPGALTLRSQLDLWWMLHPAVQPISKLDYEYPPETVTVIFRSAAFMQLISPGTVQKVSDREVRVTAQPKENQWLPVEIMLATGTTAAELNVSFFTNEDPRERPLLLRRILLPWATPYNPQAVVAGPRQIPEIAGGDWQRGKKVFYGDKAACYKCHQVNGEGGKIGPDLSSLTQRDYASVLKDITQPSAAINPDHIAYNLELKDGTSLTGVVMSDNGENIVLGQVTGQGITVARSQIASMRASSISLMPEGLLQQLSTEEQKDLLTFLLMAEPGK